ncbi:Cation transporter P-type ATPase [Mycoplasmopsis meleagridis]|uniref:Cation transporter P-type ATPase n=1 Tax=Mycoplasmopsis meleagridis ATCC 25294 TaxID=1264554 RepID=A0A0F5H0S8_9BACT|nr:cation-translocating P-type ATPase [Mycoplasmopsis meleagridis]KKB26808.1 Cation transporter P-type ATPase [Mycoplasmopsis meleagridis ATCC 25294]OAD18412.1 Cation transporter P-type ATPase [Mycoplasmopsis meleagridis]VEU77453.1 Calcium-transporting ATPase lmo0841 [Mycoplasmopsis meleagridis]
MNKEISYYKSGLTSSEVVQKRKEFGKNTLIKEKKVNWFIAFLKQFMDPMVILLIIAAIVSLSLAIYTSISGNSSSTEQIVSFIEPAIIVLVIVLNSSLGAYQEVKSDQAVRALAKLNEANATVIRDNKTEIILAEELVVGDILLLNAGDFISADARLIESFNLKVVESSLTGESLSVDKEADFGKENDPILANNKHLIYSGTYVTNGRAIAVVEKIGHNTEIGKINDMIQNQKKNATPLQIKLNKLSKIFGISGIILFFISFIIQIVLINVIKNSWSEPRPYIDSLVIGISLAVAAIPEGLITFTTVLLSIGVAQMSKQKALAKNLLAVETLGSVSIICSDKTGTLTENKMTVVDGYLNNKYLSQLTDIDDDFILLAKYLTLCNDANISYDERNQIYKEIGDPTEIGLLKFAHKYDITKEKLNKEFNIIHALPFDSDRKLSSVLVEKNNKKYLITKGAPDVILNRSLIDDNNSEEIHNVNSFFAKKSYRVLAVGIKELNKNNIDFEDENNLIFVGLVAMIDPPRANVKNSISLAKKAGIKTVMITGDHLDTAVAIAKDLGIYNANDLAVNGNELASWNDDELKEKVSSISVYARVNPSDKLRIVKAWQAHEKVVAMTGDGVNDAPALKASDIGCAMGITGTDVSKQAADLVLVDDNFNTIVNSVKNGRLIFDKIKVVIMNLLISSLTEVLVMLIGMIAFFLYFKDKLGEAEFYIFGASQLLWINLLTHGLPAIALGLVNSEKNVMNRDPYSKNESIFSRGMGLSLLLQSLLLSLLTLIAFWLGGYIAMQKENVNGEEILKAASTAGFLTLGIAASLNSINLMSEKSIFKSSLKRYWIVWVAALFSVLCTMFVVFVPYLSEIFRMVTNVWAMPILLAVSIPLALILTFSNEMYKLFKFLKNKNSNNKI